MIGFQILFYILMAAGVNNEGSPMSYIFFGILILSYIYMVVYTCIPRCRDCGLNPWTLLIFFIPMVNIAYGLFLALMKPKEEREKRLFTDFGHSSLRVDRLGRS